jgi:CHAT domain-containing protein
VVRGNGAGRASRGPLTQLPFQVLVTAPPASGDHESAAWLIRNHALTVLPAVSSLREPGLILTPPREASEEDDGYLSASEIAGLRLDADWVILSACNTAAGNASGAQALSGLARAFFYAQARALLVRTGRWTLPPR